MLQGLTGSFFRPLAVAYALAVLASMVVALTVTPALAMVLMPGARLNAADPPLIGWCKRQYRRLLGPSIRRPVVAGAAVVTAIVAGFLVLPGLGQDLFPNFKERNLLMHFNTKPGTSLPEMKRVVSRLQQKLLSLPGDPVNRPSAAAEEAQRWTRDRSARSIRARKTGAAKRTRSRSAVPQAVRPPVGGDRNVTE